MHSEIEKDDSINEAQQDITKQYEIVERKAWESR